MRDRADITAEADTLRLILADLEDLGQAAMRVNREIAKVALALAAGSDAAAASAIAAGSDALTDVVRAHTRILPLIHGRAIVLNRQADEVTS